MRFEKKKRKRDKEKKKGDKYMYVVYKCFISFYD